MRLSTDRNSQKSFELALKYLESGDKKKAKEEFAFLLEREPENIEFQAGFFCAGWWLNRETNTDSYAAGRSLASWLMREWDDFSQRAKERAYQNCLSFEKVMYFALNTAASNFRLAFQEENPSSSDPKLLKELSLCLFQLRDYENAIEILGYARKKNPHDPELSFLLGDALCSDDSKKENMDHGLSYYRDSFLIDPRVTKPAWITSPIAREVLRNLEKRYQKDLERTLDWFPAYLILSSFPHSLRPLKEVQLREIHLEIEHLLKEKKRGVEKYRDRICAILSFYLLVLIYQYKSYENEASQLYSYEEELRQVSSELYGLAREEGLVKKIEV